MLLHLLNILFLPGLSTATCYYPSGNPATSDVPCTPVDIQRDAGCAIVPYNVTNEGVTYCCNSIVNNRSDIRPACVSGTDPIILLSATIIPGVALLEDYTLRSNIDSVNTTASSTQSELEACPDSSSSNTAMIGAGVGVPLGVIGLVGIAEEFLRKAANWKPQYSEPVELGDGSRAFNRL
ncbi:hypothetical protein BDW67DRAFT_180735 [Aspergillus spinulosporus]